MSYKNLKLRKWTSPQGEVRLYINTRYVEGRNVMSWCDGDFIIADENGNAKATFKGTRNGNAAEMGAMGRAEVMEMLILNGRSVSFSELVERVEQCQTEGGNFSYAKYEKAYG